MLDKAAISHIGVAVADLEAAKTFYEQLLGRPADLEEEVAEQRVAVAMFAGRTGDASVLPHGRIELVAATSDDSPIAKFIAKQGEGLHHICVYVDDIEAKLQELDNAGVRLIDREPRIGAEGKRIAFVHPKSTGGVLIELEER